MKIRKSLLAVLLLGSLTMAGCSFEDLMFWKKKEETPQTPADSGGGGQSTEDKYTVSFNGNGGTGSMAAVGEVSGSYTLPANGFTAPENQHFAGWKVNNEGEVKQPGAVISVSANIILYAQWENDLPPQQVEAPFIRHGSGTTWTDVALVEDPSDNTQYKISLDLAENEEFVICVNDKTEPQDWRHYEQRGETGVASEVVQGEGSGEEHNFKVNAAGTYDIYIKKDKTADGGHTVYISKQGSEPPVVTAHKLVISRPGSEQDIEVELELKTGSQSEYKVSGQQLLENDQFIMVVGEKTYKYEDLKVGTGEGHVGGGVQDLFEEGTDGKIKVKASHKYDLYLETEGDSKGIYTFAAYFMYQQPEAEWLTPDVSLKVDPDAEGPITEYVFPETHLAEGTKFLFRIGEKYYKFEDLKEGVTGITQDEDGNLVTGAAGKYTIFCDTVADEQGNFIWVACTPDEVPPVQVTGVLKLTHGSETTNVELQVHNETEYYVRGLEIEAGDKFIIEIGEDTYDYTDIKSGGFSEEGFTTEAESDKFVCIEGHHYDIYVETAPSAGDKVHGVYIETKDCFIKYTDSSLSDVHIATGVYQLEENQYFFDDVLLRHDARFKFYFDGIYRASEEIVEDASPVKPWIQQEYDSLIMAMGGKFDFYFKPNSEQFYVDGTPTIEDSYYTVNDGEHQLLSLKPGSHNEYKVTLTLAVNDVLKLHSGFSGQYETYIKNEGGLGDYFVKEGDGIKCTHAGSYTFYLLFVVINPSTDVGGIWIAEDTPAVQHTYSFVCTDSEDMTRDGAEIWAWYWTDSESTWKKITPTEVNEFTLELSSDVIGILFVRVNSAKDVKPTEGAHEWGTYESGTIWSQSANIALSGQTTPLEFHF